MKRLRRDRLISPRSIGAVEILGVVEISKHCRALKALYRSVGVVEMRRHRRVQMAS